jgi:hypothetical protein
MSLPCLNFRGYARCKGSIAELVIPPVTAKLKECHLAVRVFDRILDHACCLQPKPVGISLRPMLDVKRQQALSGRNRDKSPKRA